MTARKPAAGAVAADPDRPLLRLLNRAGKKPVLAMCGLPGNHDPAHAAAGRLRVRFHRFSDVRLFWREFRGGYREGDCQRFAALVVLTNAGEPTVDPFSTRTMAEFYGHSIPILWGEAGPGRAVMWRPEFHLERINPPPVEQQENIEALFIEVLGEGYADHGWSVGDSHYRLVEGPA
jgi:hypothetical protein